ncbi:hypothetical protein niasHT_020963 [Heterodera trifolii]|uniref:Flavin-containing monooxygenase n=1 Tax=Heterodera trifolii TaxID=157864 RepID=A0ABD2KD56_9BILA
MQATRLRRVRFRIALPRRAVGPLDFVLFGTGYRFNLPFFAQLFAPFSLNLPLALQLRDGIRPPPFSLAMGMSSVRWLAMSRIRTSSSRCSSSD